eukprot:scaffold22332_cov61-Attheya_sp.AAC.3
MYAQNKPSPKKKNDEKKEDSCLALPALDSSKKIVEPTKLDSDSFVIAIDNCCTTSVTNNLKDFVTPPKNRNTS